MNLLTEVLRCTQHLPKFQRVVKWNFEHNTRTGKETTLLGTVANYHCM
jgi:hypothetical protein